MEELGKYSLSSAMLRDVAELTVLKIKMFYLQKVTSFDKIEMSMNRQETKNLLPFVLWFLA